MPRARVDHGGVHYCNATLALALAFAFDIFAFTFTFARGTRIGIWHSIRSGNWDGILFAVVLVLVLVLAFKLQLRAWWGQYSEMLQTPPFDIPGG